MGSSYYGEPNMANERAVGGSSRKGKKSNSDKPKQPQRGLGVAQLEKIRLHGQMASSYHPSFHTPPYPTNFNQDDMRMQTAYSSPPSSSFSYSSASSASYAFHPSMMMGPSEYERANIRYGDSQPPTAASWNPNHGFLETQHLAQPSMTRHLLNLHLEDEKNKKQRSNSTGSSSQHSESSDAQELDLELKLSL